MKKLLTLLVVLNCFWAHAQWELVYTDASSILYDVCCINTQQIVAVGDNGKILISNNGGVLWSERSIGINCKLIKVRFANELIGYVSGIDSNHSYLFQTLDGGIHWNNITPTLIDVIDFSCPQPNALWVTSAPFSLYKSQDSGAHFSLVNTQAPVQTIQFIDDINGFGSVGNNLSKTIDGGLTWTAIGLVDYGERRAAFDFYNQNVGFTKHGNTLYRTTDGGAYFEMINFLDYPALQLFATSEDIAWGTPAETVINQPENLKTFKIDLSQNGFSFEEGQPIFSAFYFAHPTVGFAVNYNGQIYKNTTGSLATSSARQKNQIKVYPNPASGFVYLQTQQPMHIQKILVLDDLGRVIYQNRLPVENNISLDVRAFARGCYWVVVESDEGRWVEQLVVE
ncbi:T9SS type A sorting domain-containing protein [Flavobacterium sp. CYK-55]|uniref:YCF48-related protein n=1 Tax=Flavobacterium sp. CYK-55 TaxID=2835529 RepID=UPI001BD1282E|nr:YCF48-related protein [Flavobacterium sp. CYK-55]MBS7787863.1 T9SS type A sorting domain-containing protein [Flavobacterium sp. CYK-55]